MNPMIVRVCGLLIAVLGATGLTRAGTSSDCSGHLQVVWFSNGSYQATLAWCTDSCDGHDCAQAISLQTGNPFCMCPTGNNECTLSWEGQGAPGSFLLVCLFPCSPGACQSLNGWGHGHQWFECQCA